MACIASDALISGIDIDWSTLLSGLMGVEGALELVKQGLAWQRVEEEECIGQSFVSDHGSVLPIMSALNAGDPLKPQLNTLSHIARGVSSDSDTGLVYSWLCSAYTADTDVGTGRDGLGCDIDALRAQAST